MARYLSVGLALRELLSQTVSLLLEVLVRGHVPRLQHELSKNSPMAVRRALQRLVYSVLALQHLRMANPPCCLLRSALGRTARRLALVLGTLEVVPPDRCVRELGVDFAEVRCPARGQGTHGG